MSEHPTPDEVRASIVPDSTQINAEDFTGGPQTFTITGVKRGNKEQPIQVQLAECDRVYRPCKTCRRILIATFGDDPKNWVGQRMTLYCDKDVVFAGVRVGGIRISHLSGLDGPRTFMLTRSRAKRSEVVIHPLAAAPTLSDEDREFVEAARKEIAEAPSVEMLEHFAKILKGKPEGVRESLRRAYKQRMEELKGVHDA